MHALLIAALALPALQAAGGPGPIKPVRRDAPFRAYWLTAGEEAKAGYVRLLVTHGPLEDLAGHGPWATFPLDNWGFTFLTYKRDSFWSNPFHVVRQVGAVGEKTAMIDGISYAYEPCPLTDLLRLLDKPEGTLPIHRREAPLAGAEVTARAFRLLLLEQMKEK